MLGMQLFIGAISIRLPKDPIIPHALLRVDVFLVEKLKTSKILKKYFPTKMQNKEVFNGFLNKSIFLQKINKKTNKKWKKRKKDTCVTVISEITVYVIQYPSERLINHGIFPYIFPDYFQLRCSNITVSNTYLAVNVHGCF